MKQIDENEYQGRDPKRMTADVDAIVKLARNMVPLFVFFLLIHFLSKIFEMA